MKLDKDGGITIYIAAKKPKGVPEENWLPINRNDEDIGAIMRIYVPDLEKMKTWKAPKGRELLKTNKLNTGGSIMKKKKLLVVVCFLGAFMLLAGIVRTAPAAQTDEQKQLRNEVTKQLSDMGMPVLTGTVWQKATQDEKVAFVWGFCHVVTIEQALMANIPQLKVENFSAKVVEGMAGVKMNDIVGKVDEYYAAHPTQIEESVVQVMWDTAIKPNLKTGIAGLPLQK